MTDIDICNLALSRLGAEQITSLEDNTKRAKLCKLHYEVIKEEMFETHGWRFARKRKRSTGSANSQFGYAYRHALPTDYEKMVMAEDQESQWEVESGYLYSDTSTINYIYSIKVTEDKMPAYFIVAFAARLAKELCYSLIQSSELQQVVEAEYTEKLSKARFTDSGNTGAFDYKADEWRLARL